ncbi:MAG: DUF732 domain-containing protein [Mycobacterium sp.]
MKLRRISASLLLAGVLGGGVFAAPAQAEPVNVDNFLNTLDSLGITNINPADAVALGQSLCPMLAERGQNTADIAAKVSDAIGQPLGAAPMFTGAAISFLCPRAVDNVANGRSLFPLFGG